MVVDDSTFMRKSIKKILLKMGFSSIIEAKSGEEAVLKYLLHRPYLVTMDITLPNINGIEATRRILKKDPKALVVMCSSMGQKILIEESLKAGAIDFVVKPFQEKKINAIIGKYLP